MKRDVIWTNKDGLKVGFGTREPDVNAGAVVVAGDGQVRTVVMKIVATELGTTADVGSVTNSAVLPAGAHVLSCDVCVDTGFTGGGTLDVGAYNANTEAVISDNAFCDAATQVELASAGTVWAGAGGYVGDVLAANVKVGASYNTTAFTGGVATVSITYRVPEA